MILILDGRGSTSVWNDDGKRITFEWKAGAMFAIPLNCWHQHFNGSGQEAARYVGVTNAPAVMNLYDDVNFVFNTAYDFKNRFAGEPDYFTPKAEKKGFLLVTNFVPDAVNLPLISAKERGAGGGHIRFNMAKGSMSSHISQFPVGTYKKAHCHGPSAHVIILSGEGYSLMWQEGEEPQRYDWQVGTLIVPPNKMVPPALQHRPDAGALSRLQARGRAHPQCAGRADRLDQPPHRRRPDRLCRREAGNPQHVRGGAGQARHARRAWTTPIRPSLPTCRRSCRRARRRNRRAIDEWHHRSARARTRPCADPRGQFLRRGGEGLRAVPQGLRRAGSTW